MFTAELSKSVGTGPHATLFLIHIQKASDELLASSGHFYPIIFPNLLVPNAGRASAVLSVVCLCTKAYTLSRSDTIEVCPVQMEFSMIAQRTAKDNCSPNLISTKRWWALFWLPWLTACVYVGLLRSNGISPALSARTCLSILFFILGLFDSPVWVLYNLYHTKDKVWMCACGCLYVHAQKLVI